MAIWIGIVLAIIIVLLSWVILFLISLLKMTCEDIRSLQEELYGQLKKETEDEIEDRLNRKSTPLVSQGSVARNKHKQSSGLSNMKARLTQVLETDAVSDYSKNSIPKKQASKVKLPKDWGTLRTDTGELLPPKPSGKATDGTDGYSDYTVWKSGNRISDRGKK